MSTGRSNPPVSHQAVRLPVLPLPVESPAVGPHVPTLSKASDGYTVTVTLDAFYGKGFSLRCLRLNRCYGGHVFTVKSASNRMVPDFGTKAGTIYTFTTIFTGVKSGWSLAQKVL